MIPFKNTEVENVYLSFDESSRQTLLQIRDLIYKTENKLKESNIPFLEIEENLKWGQPSYSTKTGTPIRLYTFEDNKVGLFVHCQTTLIETFKKIFKNDLSFSKNRAIILDPNQEIPTKELEFCIELALTYYLKNN